MDCILKYFPDLNGGQKDAFLKLKDIYHYWNSKINVISRKDIDQIYERHVLHSLAIAKFIHFTAGTNVLDVGTGGGFPGIPLAILFPEVSFYLIDSIGKKIKVVDAVISELKLMNIQAKQIRAENINTQFDFIISRAVTSFPVFLKWVKDLISNKNKNSIPNGIIYLKGGDISKEISNFVDYIKVYNILDYFKEEFFETKKIIYFSN